MSAAQQLIPVPFYEDTLVLVRQANEPYVAMKPVVENMGLAWQAQHVKLAEKFGSVITIIVTTGADGKRYDMTCLPLKKLPAWLYSINPSKVKPELREKIVRYQNECDDALWNYWTKGCAVRGDAPNTTQRIALSRHRLALAKELYKTRDPALRQTIHQQLDEASRAMGLPTPEIDSLGAATPTAPDVLKGFWQALAFLDSKGVAYNHSRAANLLAVNLPELARLLIEHGHPLRFDSALRQGLWLSSAPRCLHKNHPTKSRLVDKTVRCWIFAMHPTAKELSEV
ncbi:TPA: phage antirepressor N-terminal domain-containing protein [Pseudomonas aeruginosa]|nr:hypothetical protein [Pseudomonas aeruginosa]